MSGDLGYLDADGHLWIVGRQKEMIIRGGHNVVPGEVEAALFEHPAVAEAAVAGIPHPVLGEDVGAWVVLRETTDLDQLRGFLLERLADYKVPRRITVLDALPRNESGKVVKSLLVQGAEPRSAP
jgi:acyl-CoA synthetase (AMP-forming)/AMP-acid ligase II